SLRARLLLGVVDLDRHQRRQVLATDHRGAPDVAEAATAQDRLQPEALAQDHPGGKVGQPHRSTSRRYSLPPASAKTGVAITKRDSGPTPGTRRSASRKPLRASSRSSSRRSGTLPLIAQAHSSNRRGPGGSWW